MHTTMMWLHTHTHTHSLTHSHTCELCAHAVHVWKDVRCRLYTHTLTHTHIDETHNAPHTAHTNSHDICNCTACINNRHRQAHIDHDIQSTFHILPHIHNMCTQLITPCDRYSLQCCVSKHITTICVQPHHCCMHVVLYLWLLKVDSEHQLDYNLNYHIHCVSHSK